jgi:hypothetical protein
MLQAVTQHRRHTYGILHRLERLCMWAVYCDCTCPLRRNDNPQTKVCA